MREVIMINDFCRIKISNLLKRNTYFNRISMECSTGLDDIEVFEDFGYYLKNGEAYSTIDDGYIGDKELAEEICVKLGIKPRKRSPRDTDCSIGYCNKDRRWYGYSAKNRIIHGFDVGFEVKKDSIPSNDFPVGTTTGSEDECMEMAKKYAEYVNK